MTTTASNPTDSLRQAAVLVRSLDSEAVATLLARLSPAEARAIRNAVRELGEVTDGEQLTVADALRNASLSNDQRGVEVEIPSTPALPHPEPSDAAPASPLGKLSQAAPATLSACLAAEQPATVAVVLSCLAPRQAAEVLNGLPHALQTQAIDRLAELGDIDADSLSVIASELETWIADHTRDQRRRDDRRAMLQAILDASPSESREWLGLQIARHLPEVVRKEEPDRPQATEEPELERVAIETPAPQPPKPHLPFSRLESLPVDALARVLSRVDRQTLILALIGASDAFMARLRKTASRKQIRLLEQRIASAGPVRLQDIERAQLRICETAATVLVQANGGA